MLPTASTRRSPRRRLGDRAEAVAARWLVSQGWTILARNIVVGRDELDLIALEPAAEGCSPCLVFVEVRSHSTGRYGTPEESVTARKLAGTYRAAFTLLRGGCLPDGTPSPSLAWRVDLVAVDISPIIGKGFGGPRFRHVRGVTPN